MVDLNKNLFIYLFIKLCQEQQQQLEHRQIDN